MDHHISRQGLGNKIIIPTEVNEKQIEGEIESIASMKNVYEKEMKNLKAKLKIKADFMTIIEYERTLTNSIAKYNNLEQEKKNLERKIKKTSKGLEKTFALKMKEEDDEEQDNRYKILTKEYERTEIFEGKLKAERNAESSKAEKIKILQENINKITKELEELKKEGSTFKNSTTRTNPKDLEEAKNKLNELTNEYMSKSRRIKLKIKSLETKLNGIIATWMTLNKVII